MSKFLTTLDNAPLGTILKERRIAANVTMQELADAVGVTRVTVNNIENGKFNVLFIHVVNICRYLKVPLTELIGEKNET